MKHLTRAEIEMLARLWRRGKDSWDMQSISNIREAVICRNMREIREAAKALEPA